MKNSNQNSANSTVSPFEIIIKKVLNVRTQSLETMAFVFYQN